MKKEVIERFYDITSDFNDSLSLIAILLIVNKKTELNFIDLKYKLCELEFNSDMIDDIEEVSLSIRSEDLGRLIRLISPIDGLFVREKPRDIPSVITEGRKRYKNKRTAKAKRKSRQKPKRTTEADILSRTPTLF